MPDMVLVVALAAAIAGSAGLVGLAADQISSAAIESGMSAPLDQRSADRPGG